MKPSIFSTGIAFLLLGVALVAWGFLRIIPNPLFIGGGAALGLTGVGLFLRARLAHRAGMVLATAATGFGGWNAYRAFEGAQHGELVKFAAMAAVGLYLLVSLTVVRGQFRTARKA
jgi:hypothetical protein